MKEITQLLEEFWIVKDKNKHRQSDEELSDGFCGLETICYQ